MFRVPFKSSEKGVYRSKQPRSYVSRFPGLEIILHMDDIIYPKNRTIKQITAAITWLSVKEEISTPMAIAAIPYRKKARIAR